MDEFHIQSINDDNYETCSSLPSAALSHEIEEVLNKSSITSPNSYENDVSEIYLPATDKRSPMLPGIFVKIPLYFNQQYQNKQKSEEIKSEPIKSELYEQQNITLNALTIDKNSDVSTSSIRSATATPDENTTVIQTPPLPVLLNIINNSDISNNNNCNNFQCLKCTSCPYLTLKQELLDEHMEVLHHVTSTTSAMPNLQVLTCPGCANIFHSINVLKIHLELDHLMLQPEIDFISNNYHNILPSKNLNNKSRIYIKNVQLLKKPDLIQQNSFSNNITTNTNMPERKKSKFFIKNIQLLRKPDFVQSANTTNLFDEINLTQPNEFNSDHQYHNQTDNDIVKMGDSSSTTNLTYSQNMSDMHESQYSFVVPAETEEKELNSLNNYNVINSLNEYLPPEDQYNSNDIFDDNTYEHNSLSQHPSYANDEKIPIISEANNFYFSNDILDVDAEIDTPITSSVTTTSQQCGKFQTPTIHLKSVDELNLMTFDQVHNINLQQSATNIINNNINSNLHVDSTISLDNDATLGYDSFNHANIQPMQTDNMNNFNEIIDLNNQLDLNNIETPKIISNNNNQQYFDNDFIIIPPNVLNNLHRSLPNHPNAHHHEDDHLDSLIMEQNNDDHQKHNFTDETDEDILFVCAEEIINSNEINNDVKVSIANLSENEKIQTVKNNLIFNTSQLLLETGNSMKPVISANKGPRLKKRLNKNDNIHKCLFNCSMAFKEEANLAYHLKCHHVLDVSTSIICPECKRTDFKKWNTLHSHLWRIHDIDMELFSCDICSFKTPSWSILQNTHIKIHSNEKKFKCEMCDKAFKNTKQLKNHRNRHRPKKMDIVRNCEQCNKSFKNIRLLKKHANLVHPTPELKALQKKKVVAVKPVEKFSCKVCCKTFDTKNSLRHHSFKHVENKRFKCEHCDYATNDHNSFRRHKMRYDEKKMYKCSFCKYKSIQSTSYRIHLEKQHPNEAAHLLFKCVDCTFISISKYKYESHIQKHLNEKTNKPKSKRTSASISDGSSPVITVFDPSSQSTKKTSPISVPDEKPRKKIKVKSNSVLTDPSKLKHLSENTFLQNLLPNQIAENTTDDTISLMSNKSAPHQPLIRPALFANNFSKIDNLHSNQLAEPKTIAMMTERVD